MRTETQPGLAPSAAADPVGAIAAALKAVAIRAGDYGLYADDARRLLGEAQTAASTLKRALEQGLEAGAFRRRCEAELRSVEAGLEAVEALLRTAGGLPPLKPTVLVVHKAAEALGQVRDGLVEIRSTYSGYMEVLNRPAPAVDVKALEERGQADRASGRYLRYTTAEELAERL